jgi:dihydroneopterin aldolase
LERKAGTPLEISLKIALKREIEANWELNQSVDYADLVALVQSLAKAECELLEDLGDRILSEVAVRYPQLESAHVSIAKPQIHIAGAKLESCSVELSRVFRH